MNIQSSIDFSDLENLNDLNGPTKSKPVFVDTIPCLKCTGKGKIIIGYVNQRWAPCFACKGTGQVRRDYQKRRDAWKKGQETHRKNVATRITQFMEEHPAEMEWMVRSASRGFEFAASLLNSLNQYGSLTEKQIAAIRKCLHSEVVRAEQRAKDQAGRNVQLDSNAALILQSLQKAYNSQISRPKLRTETAVFSLAGPKSKNPGCVYITTPDREYLGKITPEGVFKPVPACRDDQKASIMEIAKDPLSAATLHGKKFGICSCCGRRLDNEESIKLGIGPICRSKYF